MSTPLVTPTVPPTRVAQTGIAGRHKSILMLNFLGAAPSLALVVFAGFAVIRVAQAFWRQVGDPWSEIAVAWPFVVLVFAAGVLLLAAANTLDRIWHPPAEYIRKFAHVGAGAIAFFAPVFFSSHWPLLLLAIIFSAVLLTSRHLGWLPSLHLTEQRGQGYILFLWAVYLVFLLAEGHNLMFQAPVLVLTVGDTAAALIGQRYGRTRYRVSGSTRTLEGTLGFVITTWLSVLILLLATADMPLLQSAFLSLVVAFIASVVEALTPKGLDNLSIPTVTFFLVVALLN